MNCFISKIIILFISISVLTLLMFSSLSAGAVLAEENLERTCLQISDNNFNCSNMTGSDCRTLLEKCVTFYEEESNRIAQDITKTQAEKKTLQSQITALKKKVQGLEYEIKRGNIIVKDLTLQINETKSSIDKITLQIEESKYQISNILRAINEEDQKSSVEILIEGDLSAFFNNLVYLEGLNTKLGDLLKNTQDLKSYLGGQKIKMDDEKSQTERTIKVQSLQKQESESSKKQQEVLLKLTEAEYQKQLQEKQDKEKKATAIRARIFDLLGVSKAPTFGEAYEIAKYASGITGVRPALLLAVLTQESNIGKQMGQCYLKSINNGSGIRISTGANVSHVMNPASVSYFLDIINQLNKSKGLARDPFQTPISCPIASVGGYGGAMGPAQFTPSTWSKYGYGKKVEAITGKIGDPWDIKDAFLAAAFLLKDNGGANKSAGSKAEFKAVMMYFSGASWRKSEEFYGRSVLAIATGYTDDIAALEN